MIRLVLLFCCCFLIANGLIAQTRTVSGTVVDQKAKTPLVGASVRLQSLSDSTSQSTISDSTGTFTFTNLKKDSFLLSISYVGYNPVLRRISIDTTDVHIDIAAVTGASGELETVVIRTSVSPVAQKGDTLQISASQFKVNPDASGEDLIRKVPGVTIENGQVKAQGENVQKVTIDGRELFGDDATAALRNLPAEVIDKIQIFDRLSDQAQFTGFDDGNTNKSINIVTKANMRNGQFGRIYAGYGTDDRYSAGGNATILKGNRRISLVGNFNNINQQNFSQQDLLGVTSNPQRGGANNRGGFGGGGGGQRGGAGGGQRGGGGNQGAGNFGGGGGNFLVGQQNGINKTNAFGVNYSDIWSKKVTTTGSYLFNNTNNNTLETGTTQYYTGGGVIDTSSSFSRNNNHRVNLRIEYRIDSNNQIIFTPNLSFQDNSSTRQTSRVTAVSLSAVQRSLSQNNSISNRSGNNLNNSILYRHSFAKRGRTFSINLNTAYNKRVGESYVNTLFRDIDGQGNIEDSTSNTFTDQKSDGLQLSANAAYTEPLGQNSQLQFNYQPNVSKSNSDQQAYLFDSVDKTYSIFQNNLSNSFESKTIAQNGGVSYRYGNRDRQIAFGVNYQHTNLLSDRIFPIKAHVDKSYSNVLPIAMIRYKISARSSLRLFYRANVNQPSVTQLQDVLDQTNAPVYTLGNPNLDQQYMHTLSTQYTFTNTSKGLLLVGNIFYQAANDYIANATYTNLKSDTVVAGETLKIGSRLTQPINLDGYKSLRSFVTFAIPVKFIKSNFNLNGGVTFSRLPGINNTVVNETRNRTITIGSVIASNVSQYVDFTISYAANFSKAQNKILLTDETYSQHTAGLQMNLLSKNGWFFQNDVNYQHYSGLNVSDPNFLLWNMGAGKKFLKDKKGELKISIFDLLKQNKSISRTVDDYGIVDVQSRVLQQYFMLTFTYNLRNFGTAAARAMNRNNSNNAAGSRF
ncbi:MAG: outer membrane beta-barrel protein [Flavisolibacter sp.]